MKSFRLNLFLIFFLFGMSLHAQKKNAFGFELREYLTQLDTEVLVPLLVEGDKDKMMDLVSSLGGQIGLQVDNLFSLQIPSSKVVEFSRSSIVHQIEFTTNKGQALSDTMLVHTNVDSVLKMHFPLRDRLSGKGVILGIIDSGIELNHADFKDSSGNTRVLYIWDQKAAYNPNRQAANYTYGVQWDSTDINNGISTHDDDASQFGHGSNVSGVAASNGLASGQFKGVAPEVNIISVATNFNRVNWLQTVAEAVDYIFKKADTLGMPCVINASIGTYIGSHDGLDIAARMIDKMIRAKNGRAFVCAAGNAGTLSFHLQQSPNNDSSFTWFKSHPAQWSGRGGIYYEMWSDTNDFNGVQFAFGADKSQNGKFQFRGRTAFDSIQNRLNQIYRDTLFSLSSNPLAIIETYAEQSQGRYKLEIAIIDPDSANYNFRFETIGTGKLDIWSSRSLFRHSDMIKDNLPSSTAFPPILNYVRPDSLQTMVSSFSCLPSVITVGNYVNRGEYFDVTGTLRSTNNTPGEISINSSLGPNRKGFLKPNITSAGDYMFSAGRIATINQAITSNPSKVSQDSLHYRNGGTSMASPTVAGMIALYLQMCPNSNFQQIINDLSNTARKDNFTINLPNPQWGNGKADGFQLIKSKSFFPKLNFNKSSICIGDTLLISSSIQAKSYFWNTGDTNAEIQLTNTKNIYVTLEDSNGCRANSDTLRFNFLNQPNIPALIRNGDSLILNLQNGSFQWYRNQTALINETSKLLIVNQSGDYYCQYTDTNGCSINSDTIKVISTGIEEGYTSKYKISPNPTTSSLDIQFITEVFVESIEIVNLKGNTIYEYRPEASRQHINLKLGHLSKGLYLLKIKSNNAIDVEKIILE